MAQTAGSPELTPRQGSRALPTWNMNSDLEDETLLKAFETYKKKRFFQGCCALQGRRERTNHETEHVQDYSHQSIPSCDPILEKRTGVAEWRGSVPIYQFHLFASSR